MYDSDIKSLVYWLFFIEYWIDNHFSKLAYIYWSKLSIIRYANHLLNYSDSIFFLFSDTIALLNSLINST